MNTRMKVPMRSARRRGWALGLGVLLLFALRCSAQMPAPSSNGPQSPRRIPPTREMDQTQMDTVVAGPAFNEKRLQMMNAAQHQSMVADTERLVKLVADLNAQINSSNQNSLTPEQLRMVAEIEKLAHNVKDKMRMAVRSASNFEGPVPPFVPR